MKRGSIVEGKIEFTEFPNKSKVFIEEEQTYLVVKGGIPGQRIKVAVQKARKEGGKGRLLEVVEQAPKEGVSSCPHFGVCGGCSYLTLPYEEQLRLKEEQLVRLFAPIIQGEYRWEGVIPSPLSEEYRNKMEFSFGDAYKEGPLTLGMHKKGSIHDVVTVEECKLVDEDFRMILKETLIFAEESRLPYYHRMKHEGVFRHLLVRKGKKTQEILVDLITTSSENFSDNLREMWAKRLRCLPLKGRLVGILHTKNDSVADAVLDQGTEVLFGQDFFTEQLFDLDFQITPFSFFQTNSLGAEVLYEKVREYVGDTKDKVIFDLYSGTGTITQMLAPVAKKVVGVEIVEEAVEAAKMNAEKNRLGNCEFWAGDVLKVIEELDGKPDFIVLDPPRDGVHPKALEKILEFGVERIVYIACKPSSLARDLEILQGKGYQVEKLVGVDMFPGTVHVECVVLLERKYVGYRKCADK